MLSILIPVHNYQINDLSESLLKQCLKEAIDFEIIIVDDASKETYDNKTVSLLSENISFIELKENLGRSAVRNFLAKQAKFDTLLFIDSDEITISDNYIKNYIRALKTKDAKVIYGGRVYQKNPPDKNLFLRWYIGKYKECKSAEERKENPYVSFMSNNFIIKKDAFEALKFNTKISGYGYEDLLFGLNLKEKGVAIAHINNPLCHKGLDDYETFIEKTRNALKNLFYILPQLDNSIKIVKCYNLIKLLKLVFLVRLMFKAFEYHFIKNLSSKSPKLLYFDLYKIGYLCTISKKLLK